MKRETTTVNVGDWIHSDSPGIWRVYRIIENVQWMRFDLQERKRIDRNRFVFSKRFLDTSWQPAFTNEVANAEFVDPLSAEEKRRLADFIDGHPEALEQFEAFDPEDIDIVVSLRLNVPPSVGKQDLQELVDKVFSDSEDKALSNDEVLQRIADSELSRYRTRGMSNATLQFLVKGHEVRDNEYVFREARLVMM